MRRISGHYEWDDDDLTPGQKKEGGLHQNLYDDAGKLKGNARFIPDDPHESEPIIVTETVYVTAEERRLSLGEEVLRDAVDVLVTRLVDAGIAAATPWWRNTARPALAARRAKVVEWRSRRRRVAVAEAVASTLPASVPAQRSVVDRPKMSSAEARARYLAALAAQAYGEEQMRLITESDIVDGEGVTELEQSLAALPPDQVRRLIETMATNPALLGDDNLAQLASLLGRGASNEQVARHTKPALERQPRSDARSAEGSGSDAARD